MSQNPRILLVDDEPMVLDSLRRTLSRFGFDLTCVDDPLRAASLLEQESFDVLFSDIDMPGLDGHALIQRAKTLQPTMIRIILTGRGGVETAERAINEGEVFRYIRKPFDAHELQLLTRKALDRRAELTVAEEAISRATSKRELYARLEVEYPGIEEFAVDESGVYIVNTAWLEQKAIAMGLL